MKRLNLLFILLLGITSVSPVRGQQAAPSPASPVVPMNEEVEINETEDEQLSTEQNATKEAAEEVKESNAFWSPPDFSKQDGSLGWKPDTFELPPGFQRRVNFWIDIYTKYTTHQALLHDGHYFDIVYKIVDLSDIDNDAHLNTYQKEKARRKRIKDEKREIKEQLLRIQKLTDTPSKLTPADKEIFRKFRFVFEKNKFYKAAQRNRLRMQLGQRDRYLLGLYFSGRYIREMERIFKEEQMPIELTRLPFVESSFNLYAYSKVGASGIWQFMRSTGRLFKLKADSVADQRNDPLAATRAAAKLLKFNYQLLRSWPLALTAYNHGAKGVSSIVKKLKTEDINEIVWNSTRRRFGFASENFYAEFLAALEVESHASRYFGEKVQVSPPLVYDEVSLPRPATFGEIAYSLKGSSDDGFEKARLYNPFFTRAVISGRRKIAQDYNIRVPKGLSQKFLNQLAQVDGGKIKITVRSGLYKILPGDTLSSISKDLGISVKQLLEANNMGPKSVLHPGQRIVVPTLENH